MSPFLHVPTCVRATNGAHVAGDGASPTGAGGSAALATRAGFKIGSTSERTGVWRANGSPFGAFGAAAPCPAGAFWGTAGGAP